MKLGKIMLTLVLAAVCASPAWGVERGEKTLGLRGGYNTRNESGVAGIFFQYAFSSHFRLAPNIDYVFRHNNTDAYSFNINAQFPLYFDSSRRFDVYPMAGVNAVVWNHRLNNSDGNDTSSRISRAGLNFGAGLEFYCTKSLKINFEGKFNLVKNYNSGVFSLGIGYVF